MTSYVPKALRRQVGVDAGRWCGYCFSAEAIVGIALEIEHIIPESLGGLTIRENLWLACHNCNKFKGDRINGLDPITQEIIPLFNPRTQKWSDHFRWDVSGTLIVGLTPCGRVTIDILQMNNDYVVEARQFWVMGGWHPPAPL